VCRHDSFTTVKFTVSLDTFAGSGTWAASQRGFLGNLDDFNVGVSGLGYAHIVESVIVRNVLIVEPGAVACLPGRSADHAKLSCTAASHVIATLLELDHCLAAVASLPTLFLGHLDDAVGLLILWTFPFRVEFTVAQYADLGAACAASCVLSAVGGIHFDL